MASTVPTAAGALQTAAVAGDDKTVALLLADPRSDPAAYCNQAVRVAAQRGHDKVVALLLADPRVDPSVWNCAPLCRAVASREPRAASREPYQRRPSTAPLRLSSHSFILSSTARSSRDMNIAPVYSQ